jgi:hypothetical protein
MNCLVVAAHLAPEGPQTWPLRGGSGIKKYTKTLKKTVGKKKKKRKK